ncbi:MAG: hypothetical protein ACM3QS_14145 [Bacteroidota bacterium]
MRLNPPTQVVFWIAVVLAVVGLLAQFGLFGASLAAFAFYLVLLGYIVLAVSLFLKGT